MAGNLAKDLADFKSFLRNKTRQKTQIGKGREREKT